MKKLIIGIIIGLVLGSATNAFAAVGDRVEAVFTQFNYVVNGEPVTLDSPVLVHDGNSYLRTTQISNMLGYDVTYKADSRTIEFNGTLPATNHGPAASLAPVTSPAPSAEPSPSPTPSPDPSAEPSPDQVAACQAIRDKYARQIVALEYKGLTLGKMRYEQLQLEYARDQELAAAGC